MYKDNLKKYAELIIKVGINLQKGQELYIYANTESTDLVSEILEICYKDIMSGKVHVTLSDDKLTRIEKEYASSEALETVSDFEIAKATYQIKKEIPRLFIECPNPTLLSGLDQKKLAASYKAHSLALKQYGDKADLLHLGWNIVAYVTDAWAKSVFPNLPLTESKEKLWDMVYSVTRVYENNPVIAWNNHISNLSSKAKYLNDSKIKSLHYKSGKTDFKIDLTDKYVFASAKDTNNLGLSYVPNIPTEEVFSSPDFRTATGRLTSTMPLNLRGTLIKDFWFEFKEGVVVDHGASEGLDSLTELLNTDEGSRRLGEVALVQKDSPISNLGVLFNSTLFDENASCHFALGQSFNECYFGANKMSEEERIAVGLNDSLVHVDFMVGDEDLDITGTTCNGEILPIFKNGNWAF